jgi:DNA-binding NtrC family response regulator
MADSLLIIEDERLLADELARYFRKQDWEVELTADLAQARHKLIDQGYDPLVTLADMTLPDGNSLDLLEAVRRTGQTGEWVLLTGYGSVPESVRALRLGAYDFLEKPCHLERLAAILNGARRSARAQRQLRDQREAGSRRYLPEAFVGRSAAARQVRQLLERLVEVPFSALVISGETGTGKGLVARILHHSGARADGPLVEVNCAALPRDLLESELFGHEAGAFTGAKGRHRGYLEQADGGTLFLDEIGEMDLDLQSKLLTAIEDRILRRLGGERAVKIDVQVLAASNRDLARQVREGGFRTDLYHRLSVFRMDLPPLRERLEDLVDLMPLMIAEFNAVADRRVRVVPERVYRRLRQYDWPGNVRELRNVVERAVLLADGEVFPEHWLQLGSTLGRSVTGPSTDGNRLVIPLDGSMALDEMDSYIIQTALEKTGYNITAAARALGTTRETLRYRIQKYHLRTEPAESLSGTEPGAFH